MRLKVLILALPLAAACYHAQIETGLEPGTQQIDKSWANSWIYGLVPPSTIETAAKCPTGVAKVETQLSFPNMLVGWLTSGIYTPMSVKVTCAAKKTATGPMIDGKTDATKALADAVERAAKEGAAVFVQF